MSTGETPFDPYQRAWNAYAADGLNGLDGIEAPLFVYSPDEELAEGIAESIPDLQPGDLKWMVLPDAFPVADGHLNVVGGRAVSYDAASAPERHVMDALAHVAALHIDDVLAPQYGVAKYQFGQQVPTMHSHLVPRHNQADGLDWTDKRTRLSLEERQAVRGVLGLDKIPGRRTVFETTVNAALMLFENKAH